MNYKEKVKITIVAGTFGYLHTGHKLLLDAAVKTKNFVMVGITTDEYVKRAKAYKVKSFEERSKAVIEYLNKKHCKFMIKPLNNNSGDSTNNPDYDTIIVSTETKFSAANLNNKRLQNNLDPMKIICVETQVAEDYFAISSSRIALGEINTSGRRIIPLNIVLIHANIMEEHVLQQLVRKEFYDHKINFRTKNIQREIFPDIREVLRSTTGDLKDSDYCLILFYEKVIGDGSSTPMLHIHSIILDRSGKISEGRSSGIEFSKPFYDDYIRGRLVLQSNKLLNEKIKKRMIKEAINSCLIPRLRPRDYDLIEDIVPR
jgi:pantetheine-phosphate adenylyltransferase